MMALVALSLDFFEVLKTADTSFMSSLDQDTLRLAVSESKCRASLKLYNNNTLHLFHLF